MCSFPDGGFAVVENDAKRVAIFDGIRSEWPRMNLAWWVDRIALGGVSCTGSDANRMLAVGGYEVLLFLVAWPRCLQTGAVGLPTKGFARVYSTVHYSDAVAFWEPSISRCCKRSCGAAGVGEVVKCRQKWHPALQGTPTTAVVRLETVEVACLGAWIQHVQSYLCWLTMAPVA